MTSTPLFEACPLCDSTEVVGHVPSIQKDMSLSGFEYGKCGDCATYYLRNVTAEALSAFYAALGAYESASSKTTVVTELANTLELTGDERVLDLGCGSGAWAIPMLSHCDRLTCVDLDAAGLAVLLARVPEADRRRVECHASHSLDFLRATLDGSFDLVLSMFSLEHDVNPQQVLTEIKRILRPGGRALVLVPSADALQLAVLRGGFYWFQAPWHTFIPTSEGLERAATRAGFSRCQVVVTKYRLYSWFWIRGLADRWRCRKRYDALRRLKWFVRADIAVDKLLDRISFMLRRPSYGLYVLER